MLYTPVNQFNWQANNFSDTYPGNVAATTLTAHASAHTKGSDTAMMNGIAEDCYGILILVHSGSTDATIRRQMIDLLIDPAAGVGNAGSSWSVAINNLYANSPGVGLGAIGHQYYFPLYLKAGTAIGGRTQDVVGGATVRCSVRVYGKPTHPELLKVGTKVQTLGAVTASTSGDAVTPGTAAMGSAAAITGTLTDDAWWWQLGIGSNDTTMTVNVYRFDVLAVSGTLMCAQGIVYYVPTTTEVSGKTAFGEREPICCVPGGQSLSVRAAAIATPDSSMTVVVYAVGG